VTGVLDRLERAGHLTRQRDLEDRRAVRLQLTESGKALVKRVRKALQEHVAQVLANVSEAERLTLWHALDGLDRSARGKPPA
jgi:DNA-binding MarR family transcriptional regulator